MEGGLVGCLDNHKRPYMSETKSGSPRLEVTVVRTVLFENSYHVASSEPKVFFQGGPIIYAIPLRQYGFRCGELQHSAASAR